MFSSDEQVARAQRCVVAGDAGAASVVAGEALARARAIKDRHLEAQALVTLSRAAALESRLRTAYSLAMRSVSLFDLASDDAGSADARIALSYVAAALGMSDAAALAAEDAAARCDRAGSLGAARVLNYVGVAAYWAGDFDASTHALEASFLRTSGSGTTVPLFQPLVNRAFCEMLHASAPESLTRNFRRDELELFAGKVQLLVRSNQFEPMGVATPKVALLLSRAVWALVAAKRGNQRLMDAHLRSFDREVRAFADRSWLHALPWLVRCVSRRLNGDLPGALRAARQMFEAAVNGEHGALERLAAEHGAAVAAEISGEGVEPPLPIVSSRRNRDED